MIVALNMQVGWQFDLVFLGALAVLVVVLLVTGTMMSVLEWFERMLRG